MPARVERPGPSDKEPALGVLVGDSISRANLQADSDLLGQRGLTFAGDLARKHAVLPYQSTAMPPPRAGCERMPSARRTHEPHIGFGDLENESDHPVVASEGEGRAEFMGSYGEDLADLPGPALQQIDLVFVEKH